MPRFRTAVCSTLVTVVALTAAGCGDSGRSGDAPVVTPVTSTPPGSPSPQPGGTDATAGQEEQMKIRITVGEQRFAATLFDSAAGRDLLAQLPLTIAMTDHGSVEKTGPLPAPLRLDGQPDGADPDVGDVGYYAPGNDFVLYYGDQSYYPGIVIIGRLDGDAAGRIADMEGAITATVDVHAG
ncbi:cyclophilin-like fold protein [Actinoplanes sp. DH11]|uniref:cyclophilin-like fold protein n=1 Tax=Actinoplanes sp. DH11 TaxID=2857011 RepID=UPI001E321EF8|nr:cyclophilin-like fold protein [Actinoplanes sp. DH11]